MARRLRIQYPGARYHVINRGNYRSDVFASAGAAQAFQDALAETAVAFGWHIHAYVIMRNHYHLALETPEANLVAGMHRLQSAYATRFNRFRHERGHLFQGRYQALLIEDVPALARVVNYIHLNPARARIVPPEQLAKFRWSSLLAFCRPGRPAWLECSAWLGHYRLTDDTRGWRLYIEDVLSQAGHEPDEAEARDLCEGWAIGSRAWRQVIAKGHAHLTLAAGLAHAEIRDLQRAHWMRILEDILAESGMTLDDCARHPKGACWKRDFAVRLRKTSGAGYKWIAAVLAMGSPHSVRSYVSRSILAP